MCNEQRSAIWAGWEEECTSRAGMNSIGERVAIEEVSFAGRDCGRQGIDDASEVRRWVPSFVASTRSHGLSAA